MNLKQLSLMLDLSQTTVSRALIVPLAPSLRT